METLSPCFFYVCKLPKYLEKSLFWTDGKDCRHSNVDKLCGQHFLLMETGNNGQMIRRNPHSCMVEIFADGSSGGFFWGVACCSWELQREALPGQNKSSSNSFAIDHITKPGYKNSCLPGTRYCQQQNRTIDTLHSTFLLCI